MKKISIKVNGTIPGYAKGQVFSVAADDEGTPMDQLWRRRLKDAETDKCCEIVKSRAPARSIPTERSK